SSSHPSTHSLSPLSLHDALPIYPLALLEREAARVERDPLARDGDRLRVPRSAVRELDQPRLVRAPGADAQDAAEPALLEVRLRRSEEHTSELQSRVDVVCRLVLE